MPGALAIRVPIIPPITAKDGPPIEVKYETIRYASGKPTARDKMLCFIT